MTPRPLLLLAALFTFSTCIAQSDSAWHYVDTSIRNKRNLQDMRALILQWKQQAIDRNDQAATARCFQYLVQVTDKTTEDSLFFKNSLVYDSVLRSETTGPLLKALMHILKARRIYEFKSRFHHLKGRTLFQSYDAAIDYADLSPEELDSVITSHFDKALQLTAHIQPPSGDEILWLSSNPLSMLAFNADLTDIIHVERIASMNNGPSLEAGKTTSWLTLSQDGFIALPSLPGASFQLDTIFRYYKQWMEYHRRQPEVYYYIETLARKHTYYRINSDSLTSHLYQQYLQSLVHSQLPAVKAHAVFQLCLLWSDEAAKYNRYAASPYRLYGSETSAFDSSYRLHYVKALRLYEQHKALMDSFPVFNGYLARLKAEIQTPGLQVELEDVQLPGKPVLAMLRFRNTTHLHTKIVRVNAFEELPVHLEKKPELLQKMPAVRTAVQPLQELSDYQWHHAFVKLDPLPTGRYLVLYSDQELTSTNQHINFVEISVTNIAVVNNDSRVFVLNRETGFPLQNASVITGHRRSTPKANDFVWASSPKMVNKEGYVTVNTEEDAFLKVYHQGDSVFEHINEPDFDLPDGLYSKDDYDDLLEYYEDNTKLHLFTDRAIYRPGQTVHYKGIFMIPDPKTGEWRVLNWKNLHFSFFKKLAYKIGFKFSKEKIEIEVLAPFDKTFITVKVMPDKFGSFSGSFVLPADAATGDWGFECYDIYSDSENRGDFRVEEYKRPSMELTLEKPTRELYLGDTFTVKAKVKSFAGANLERVLVKYHVTARGRLPETNGVSAEYRDDDILVGQAYTANDGTLSITVTDSLLSSLVLPKEERWSFDYYFEVQAIDPGGESHEATVKFQLSTRPVTFEVTLPAIVERKAIAPIYISPRSQFAGRVQKPVRVRLYRMARKIQMSAPFDWPATDVTLYDQQEFSRWFPQIHLHEQQPEGRELVMDTMMTAGGNDKLPMPGHLLTAGEYQMEINSIEQGRITGEWKKDFSVYDVTANQLPGPTEAFDHFAFNSLKNGEMIKWVTGNSERDLFSIYHLAYFRKNSKGITVKYEYSIRNEKKGLNQWEFPVPEDAIGNIKLTHIYIFNNRLVIQEKTIYVEGKAEIRTDIIVQQYRTKLTPGQKETFTVSVKTKSENQLAQLMTTMYDAALDKLEPHHWELPRQKLDLDLDNSWNHFITNKISSAVQFDPLRYPFDGFESGLWWLNPGGRRDIPGDTRISFDRSLEGRVSGLNYSFSANKLDELVVVGYGSVKRNLAGATAGVSIRGQASLKPYNKIPVIIDGVPFEGDINSIDVNSIVEGIVLNGADATAIYGSRAANGILLLSTKGPVQLPAAPAPPVPVIRKNFSETAFFFPHIYADRNGYYTIQFTLPESVTTWKWKMLAHTKNAVFAYQEKELFSQLPLMVQPDMPRFLYQGDKLVLKSRITNLDSVDCSGKLECVIEDAVTGADITQQLVSLAKKDFSVTRSSNSTGSFEISVPEDLLHPLRIKITATSKSYADGEEHIIPVMAKKLLVSQSLPLVLQNQRTAELSTPPMPSDAIPYGVSLYITPKPQAAMLNALPWLVNYPYGCAEQTFNKLFALAIAVKIMRIDTAIGQSLKNAKLNAVKNVDSLPGELHEQTMPWLQLNNRHLLQQQQLLKLFDTLEAKQKMSKYFDQLDEMQNPDGGISWFKDGKSDPYISCYILAGFGKMERGESPFPENIYSPYRYSTVIPKLVDYCDEQFSPLINVLSYLYARSFWIKKFPLSQSQRSKIDSTLNEYWEKSQKLSIGRQALLITVTTRLLTPENPLRRKAQEQLESIRQAAIRDDVDGIRWKELADADDLDTRSEEWVVRIAEAFEENNHDKTTVAGIITWLLRARNEHNWSSTKATADVVHLLTRQPSQTNAKSLSLTATVDKANITVTDDLFSGRSVQFAQVSRPAFPQSIAVTGPENSMITGGINYYFLTAQPPVLEEKDKVSINKILYRYSRQNAGWEELSPGTILKAGDKIKTQLTIFAPRLLQYVFIDEKRASACEPADASSGYEYGQDFTYYKSVRDVGYQFFAEKIPAGTSSISYETIVSKTGVFNYGPAVLQCMYQPDLRTWSGSYTLEVKE